MNKNKKNKRMNEGRIGAVVSGSMSWKKAKEYAQSTGTYGCETFNVESWKERKGEQICRRTAINLNNEGTRRK